MKLGVLGGKLQGLEVCYLAEKAGFKVILIDKNKECTARNFCDEFHDIDIINESERFMPILNKCDMLIPALENREVIEKVIELAKGTKTKILFDLKSYDISSSKLLSDKLFQKLKVPAPQPYPCEFPVIIKPSGLSGSKGVKIINTKEEFEKLNIDKSKWVIQEYMKGKSYSIEIIGHNGNYRTFQVTEIIVDEIYDCKRVVAYTDLSLDMQKAFSDIAVKIASALNLEGIMDVEVIYNKGQLRVLEIDARFPSQTPITIYKSTGQNMIEYLCTKKTKKDKNECGVVFEHILVKDGVLKVAGEHIISDAKKLRIVKDFFGHCEAITNYGEEDSFVATLIVKEDTIEKAKKNLERIIDNLRLKLSISKVEDFYPSDN